MDFFALARNSLENRNLFKIRRALYGQLDDFSHTNLPNFLKLINQLEFSKRNAAQLFNNTKVVDYSVSFFSFSNWGRVQIKLSQFNESISTFQSAGQMELFWIRNSHQSFINLYLLYFNVTIKVIMLLDRLIIKRSDRDDWIFIRL